MELKVRMERSVRKRSCEKRQRRRVSLLVR